MANIFWLMVLACASLQLVSYAEGQNYTVGMRVLVDRKAWQKWTGESGSTDQEAMKKEIVAMYFDVQEMYASLEAYRMYIKFVVKSIEILNTTNVLSAVGVDTSYIAIQDVKQYAMDNKMANNATADITILYTGENIAQSIKGWGQIDEVCTKLGVAISEYTGTWEDVFITAHEIGHVLALRHDGNTADSVAAECKASDQYVMTPAVPKTSKNRFTFSYCSYVRLYRNLFARTCLLDESPKDVVKGPGLGHFVNADEQCKRTFGKSSYVDRQRIWSYNKDICTILKCVTDDGIKQIMSPQGITCAPGKACVRGKCVASDTAMKSDSCMFGDAPSINYKKYKTCDDLPIWECQAMKYTCCKKCNLAKLNQPDEECRKRQHVSSALARSAYGGEAGYNNYICKTLACVRTKGDKTFSGAYTYDTYTAKDGYNPNGMICGQSKVCQDGVCVASKDGFAYNYKSCPFGNMPYTYFHPDTQTTCEIFNKQRSECRSMWQWNRSCCDTCFK